MNAIPMIERCAQHQPSSTRVDWWEGYSSWPPRDLLAACSSAPPLMWYLWYAETPDGGPPWPNQAWISIKTDWE